MTGAFPASSGDHPPVLLPGEARRKMLNASAALRRVSQTLILSSANLFRSVVESMSGTNTLSYAVLAASDRELFPRRSR